MTNITFYKKNNHFVGLEVKGHTGKEGRGKDLLCEQISTIAQMAVLGLKELSNAAEFAQISDGYLKIMLKENQIAVEKHQFLLKTCYEAFKSVTLDEKKYAKLEVKNV